MEGDTLNYLDLIEFDVVRITGRRLLRGSIDAVRPSIVNARNPSFRLVANLRFEAAKRGSLPVSWIS